MIRKRKATVYLKGLEQTEEPEAIESQTHVPPRGEWRENPELAFGVRIRVNMAIPAVWPM